MTDEDHRERRARRMNLAVMVSLFSKGGNSLIQLVALPLAMRALGDSFAVYGLMLSVMWVVYMADMGIGGGVNRRIASASARDDKEAMRRTTSVGFFATCFFCLVTAVACSLVLTFVPVTTLFGEGFAPYAGELRLCLWIGLAIFLGMVSLSTFSCVRDGMQEVHVINSFGAASNFVQAAALLVGLHYFPDVWFLIVAMFGTQFLAFLANAIHLLWKRPWLVPRWSDVSVPVIRTMLGEGFIMFLAFMLAPALQREGMKWLIGWKIGPKAVEHYTILTQLGFFAAGFVVMFMRPLWPAVTEAVSRGDFPWVRQMKNKVWLVWSVCSLLGIMCMGWCGPWLLEHVYIRKPVSLDGRDMALYGAVLSLTIWSAVNYYLLAGCGDLRRPAFLLAVESVFALLIGTAGVHYFGLDGGLAALSLAMLLFSAWVLPVRLQRLLRSQASPANPSVA